MAGHGKRAKQKFGTSVKYKIFYKGHSFLYWSLLGLKKYFSNTFIFVGNTNTFDLTFLQVTCNSLGLKDYKFVISDAWTDGQAKTVLLARQFISKEESVLISNIDTYAKLTVELPSKKFVGVVFVTSVVGDRWSFVEENSDRTLIRIKEKDPISNIGSTGHYYFNRFQDFIEILGDFNNQIIKENSEAYIAPIYNYLLKRGQVEVVHIEKNDVVFLDEYEAGDYK